MSDDHFNMIFQYNTMFEGGYSDRNELDECSLEQLLVRMHNSARKTLTNFHISVNTVLNDNHRYTGFVRQREPDYTRQHIAMIDCDTIADLYMAQTSLDMRKIKYDTIESSPGKFWIFPDFIGTMNTMGCFLEGVPGNDMKFVQSCRQQWCVSIRALPFKRGKWLKTLPVFPEEFVVENPLIRKWLGEFKRWWHSHHINAVRYNWTLGEAIKHNTVEQLLANPSVIDEISYRSDSTKSG